MSGIIITRSSAPADMEEDDTAYGAPERGWQKVDKVVIVYGRAYQVSFRHTCIETPSVQVIPTTRRVRRFGFSVQERGARAVVGMPSGGLLYGLSVVDNGPWPPKKRGGWHTLFARRAR